MITEINSDVLITVKSILAISALKFLANPQFVLLAEMVLFRQVNNAIIEIVLVVLLIVQLTLDIFV